jgi:hypothetical protein
MDAQITLVGLVLVRVNKLISQGETIMASIQELQTKVDALMASEKAREERDLAQDAVTAAQIASLQSQLAALQTISTTGGLSAADQAAVDAIMANVTAVIASLDAADPTPPAVVPAG